MIDTIVQVLICTKGNELAGASALPTFTCCISGGHRHEATPPLPSSSHQPLVYTAGMEQGGLLSWLGHYLCS